MPGNEVDELAVRKETVEVLSQNCQRIQDVFQVEIVSGFLSDDGMQWLEIGGKPSNRKEAKDYIKALCSPAEKIDMEYSGEIYPLLSNPSVHRKLEKQSNAVILFPTRGLLSIRGSDTLSVTLALSAVEELINKYLNQETSLAAGQLSPSTNLSSQRLDDELRRLSTENQSIVIEDDYYSNANDAVKRTILSWMKDDSILEHEEGDSEDVTELPQNTASGGSDSPRSVYKQNTSDFNSNVKSIPVKVAGVNAHGTGVHSVSPVKKSSSNSDIELLTPDTFVNKKISSDNTATAVTLPLPSLSNVSSNSYVSQPSLFTLSQAHEDAKSKDYLLAVGLQLGFSEEDVELVFKRHGTRLTKPQFLQYAMIVKSERERAKAITSSVPVGDVTKKGLFDDLSPHSRILNNVSSSNSVPVTTSMSTNNIPVIDLTLFSPGPDTVANKYYSYAESSIASTSQKQNEEQGEDYLLAYGLEHSFSEEDIQSVFEKYGTSMTVTNFADRAFQVKSEKEKEKILPPSSNVPKMAFPKPPSAEELASNKSLQPEILKNKKHMDHYFSQLHRDFKEEDNCDVDELKMRNFERQRLLREAYEQAGKECSTEPELEKWDEGIGMDVGFTEVENKKRKHKNTEKTSGPRKSRWSPIDDSKHSGESQQKKHQSKNKTKQGGQNKNTGAGKSTKPGPSNQQSPTDAGKRTKPGPSNQWSPTDDRTQFGDLFISKNAKGGHDDINVPIGFQANPFHHGNKGPMRETTQPIQISQNKAYTRDRTNRSPSPKGAVPKNRNISKSPQNMLHSRSSPRNTPDSAYGMPAPTITLRSNLRYIVIDGSNVAFHHGNHHVFSCKGIEIVVNYFLKRGHTEVTAFVPQWRTRSIQNNPVEDQHLLEELRKKGYLVYTPARKIGGKNIRTHDDNFVLRLAVETDGIVVTNDNFRDHYEGRPDWRDVIENRLLMYSFVGDFFMPPEDPMGPRGPTLDEFLRKDTDFTKGPACRDRPHSGSPKIDRHRYLESTRGKHHQPIPQPVVTVTTRHTQSQPVWQQGAISGQQGRHGVGQKGRVEIQGNNVGTHGLVGGKIQHLQSTGALTWQQQLLNENTQKQTQQQQQLPQGNRPQNKRPSGQGGGQTTVTGPPVRTEEQTTQLFHELRNIFPSELVKIQRILQNHARETDLQKLSIHLLDIMDET